MPVLIEKAWSLAVFSGYRASMSCFLVFEMCKFLFHVFGLDMCFSLWYMFYVFRDFFLLLGAGGV